MENKCLFEGEETPESELRWPKGKEGDVAQLGIPKPRFRLSCAEMERIRGHALTSVPDKK
jgi:hypothetical protein